MSPATSTRALLRGRLARLLAALLVLAGALTPARPSRAQAAQPEVAAMQALGLAARLHEAQEYDQALIVLLRATRMCSSNRCTAATRASILRDTGVMQFDKGEKADASALFQEALDLVPDLGWNGIYEDAGPITEWAAVKDEIAVLHEKPPEGDFQHVPEAEEVVNTPLPIYAEYNAPGVARVIVRYRVPGQTELRQRNLPHLGGGWGGTIPCADVRRGVLRYFLQAVDATGAPLGNSGDAKRMFNVPIRWAISTDPPHLPGRAPPETCTGKPVEEESPTSEGNTQAPPSAAPGEYARMWIGVAGSVDLTVLPGGTDVCSLTANAAPSAGNFYCTNTSGSDFPSRATPIENAQLLGGHAGAPTGGPASGNVRVLVTFDYAVSSHVLLGGRVGYVAQGYTGAAAARNQHGATVPIHVEARTSYLFGDAPLSRSGFAPYLFGSAGYAEFDASQPATVLLSGPTGVAGPRNVVVWSMGGPFFIAAGAGARYAFSPRVAVMTGIKAALPFGSGGIVPILAPEIELQYGF